MDTPGEMGNVKVSVGGVDPIGRKSRKRKTREKQRISLRTIR